MTGSGTNSKSTTLGQVLRPLQCLGTTSLDISQTSIHDFEQVLGQILGQEKNLPIELHPRILNKIVQEKVDFALEVTKTTQADVKGRINLELDFVSNHHLYKAQLKGPSQIVYK